MHTQNTRRPSRAARSPQPTMPPLRRLRLCTQLARAGRLACLFLSWHSVRAFPVFFTANGSAIVTSAQGANVVLQPDGAGAVVTRALLQANAGVQLNATVLNEAVLSGLLTLAQTQSATLAQLVTAANTSASATSASASSIVQTTYKLTTCGALGPSGPSLPLCRDAYAPAAWAADATVYGFGAPPNGNVSNWQWLRLQQGGRYRISVAGASSQLSLPCTCRGAVVQTVVNLPVNTVLYAMVGGQPGSPPANYQNGGSGGTFLLFANGTAVLVAGGGGGGGSGGAGCTPSGGSLCDASFTISGKQWIDSAYAPSTNGGSGGGGCGGSGLYGSAEQGSSFSALAGGYGGLNAQWAAWGGFGGGGMSVYGLNCGGGGYSGGETYGGGGGSFCGTGSCDFGYNVPNTPGYVTLTLLAT